MELINNRYKIDGIHKVESNSTVYKVTDLFDSNRALLLKLFTENNENIETINFLIENFQDISSIRHKYLLSNFYFDIVTNIDNKKTYTKQYFYTMEYIDSMTLQSFSTKLTIEEKIKIMHQLCEVIDYLHFRGKTYLCLTPNNILINESENLNNIKLKGCATSSEIVINGIYNDFDRYFIAPEIKLKSESLDKRADIFSLGMIALYIFDSTTFNETRKEEIDSLSQIDSDNKKKESLLKIICKMIEKDPNKRYSNIREVVYDVNKTFDTDYKIDVKSYRKKLNFNTKILGRDKELNIISGIDEEFSNGVYNNKLLAISGEDGIGKKRLLDEIKYRMRMKGRTVYSSRIDESGRDELKPIIEILRGMIKDCQNRKDSECQLIDKYGSELVKIIPELRFVNNTKASSILSGDREKLRLYNRIANFIVDFIHKEPTYLIIDNFHYVDPETLNFINYMIKNFKDFPLLVIIAYNKDRLESSKYLNKSISKWTSIERIEKIELLRFNLEEATEMVQNILGIDYRPIKFSTQILNESGGNPRYIEEILKNLYSIGELYICDDGCWDFEPESYSKIYLPTNIDEAIAKQIELLNKELYGIVKMVSIFNTSISKQILNKMTGIQESKLDQLIEKLVLMKILEQRVEDWGFTYDFYNIKLKKNIYYKITDDEKIELHKTAAVILEHLYQLENRINIDELIYHFTKSNQTGKAIDYLINFAKKMQEIFINSQSILLWEKARLLLSDKINNKKLEVIINLARLYSLQGQIDKALDYYNVALKCAKHLDESYYVVDCMNGMAEIYNRRNQIKEAENLVIEAKILAEALNYIDGSLKSAIIFNKIRFSKGCNEEIIEFSAKYLDLAEQENKYTYIAHLLNHIGAANFFQGNREKAIKYYKKSYEYFQKDENLIEATKPINNLGAIYGEYYDNADKAQEYFEKGLEICTKYNSLDNMITFLNNIGEMYIREYEYEKAKDYIEQTAKIARDIEDENMSNLANINMGIIYLNMGVYDECFKYYYLLKEKAENSNIIWQNQIKYYEFLSEFHFKFGQWHEALDICKKIKETHHEKDSKQYISAERLSLLIKYYHKDILDKKTINKVRMQYRDSKLMRDRRDSLLRFAFAAINAGEIEYAKDILKEDKEVSEKYNNEYFNIVRNFIMLSIDNKSIDEISKMNKMVKDRKLLSLEMLLNISLGHKYFESEEYYKAANYYITSLDIIQRVIKKIPDVEIRLRYAKINGIDNIRRKLNIIKNIILGKKKIADYNESDETSIKTIFDFTELEEILYNDDFIKTVYNQYDSKKLINIKTVEDLISRFTSDYKNNLELILRYAMRETFAENGFICVYSEDSQELEYLVSSQINIKKPNIEQIISTVRQNKKGVLIESSMKYSNGNRYTNFLQDGIKSIVCMPIFRANKNLLRTNSERRRKLKTRNKDEIIGYIYLNTDKIFNKFNSRSYNIINMLSHLAFICIDNYNLRITSYLDKLTGAYTRKFLDTAYLEIFKRAQNENDKFSIIMADIDKFKNVNDTFGHQKGDEILHEVSRILRQNVRKTDIVGRYGGEEFIIILPGTDKNKAYKIAEKIRKKIIETQLMGKDYSLTISLGISSYPVHGQYKEELIEKADQALYHAKETGRNKSIVWSSAIGKSTDRLDKLAGIVSGNTVQDHRNVLVMVEIINLIKQKIVKEDKIFLFLGRLIEIIEAYQGVLVILKNEEKIGKIYSRQRFVNDWIEEPNINKKIIERVITNRSGEYLIDWENIKDKDIITGNPNWQSIIVIPLIYEDVIRGVLQISVPIKEKEFDYNNYNFVSTIGDVIAAMI